MNRDYYRTEDIVKETGVPRETVYLWKDYGLLNMGRLSRSYGCSATEFQRFLEWSDGKNLTNEDQVRFWASMKNDSD